MDPLVSDRAGAGPIIPPEPVPAETGYDRFLPERGSIGIGLAAVLFLVVLLAPLPTLEPPAHRLAAVMAAVMVLWISEALPMPLTALIGASGCVMLGVAPAREVFAPFAAPLIFLFLGSFILARGLSLHQLDRRLAYGILSIPWVMASPARVLFAFGAVTTFLSAWLPNTAATAMMFPIGLSIWQGLSGEDEPGEPGAGSPFATGLMLMAAFGASVGGLATPIGAAPNLIGLSYLREILGRPLSFLAWCAIGVPIALLLFLYVAAYLHFCYGRRTSAGFRGRAFLLQERERLRDIGPGQRSTMIACGVTILLWFVPGLLTIMLEDRSPITAAWNRAVPEPIAALIGATLLFLLPGEHGARAMTWNEAMRIDWGIILLFGGGLSLGTLSFQTGLGEAFGRAVTSTVPLGDGLGLLFTSTLAATLLSEVTSNTAAANMFVPVVIAVAQASGADPVAPALGATLGCGLGFMLPISTPPNAIVYSSGYVPLRHMVVSGLLLSIVGVVVVVAVVWTMRGFLGADL
jgi:solute carrier family 13 (sodium-dependent dicarboxylate transporter), member 2/3/5